ncbi:con-10 family general stress protein [Rhodococcus rhodochrous]|uniref:general stress protein n=1 Tax=Rhodococcus rhodochrous TaxID=1829 RepID=UPI00177CA7F1|nr:KGG domain-containing protein [Rhodococcus rhodochrous]QOH56217.1 hypothetical protein C6Y44_09775 [Rhodococcus rhodochrous]
MPGIRGVDYIDENGIRVLTGGLKAAAVNKAKDPDFYRKIALKAQESWRNNGRAPRGFAADPELARIAGAKGGRKSRRGPAKKEAA